jgi:predicted transcriptional regulator of viral defense system
MQPATKLQKLLHVIASENTYLFTLADLRAPFSELSDAAYKMLISRCEKNGMLTRVCRGVYLANNVKYPKGKLLYHAVNKIRPERFNYLSLESQLSDLGVISQIPINWITLMSSGRSRVVKAGSFGTIEFVHTQKSQADILAHVKFDPNIGLWRASKALALTDLRRTGRNVDLIMED